MVGCEAGTCNIVSLTQDGHEASRVELWTGKTRLLAARPLQYSQALLIARLSGHLSSVLASVSLLGLPLVLVAGLVLVYNWSREAAGRS